MQDLMAGERPHFDLKNINPEVINSHLRETKEMMVMYDCGIKEVKTKLEILNNEFQIQQERNPIEYLKSRVKSLESIVKKLHKNFYFNIKILYFLKHFLHKNFFCCIPRTNVLY